VTVLPDRESAGGSPGPVPSLLVHQAHRLEHVHAQLAGLVGHADLDEHLSAARPYRHGRGGGLARDVVAGIVRTSLR
jgi:hypothetical protein